jgi:NitT/TauT family transport system substrate-binding protein
MLDKTAPIGHSSTVALVPSRTKRGASLLDTFGGASYDNLVKIRIGHLSTFYHTAILLMAREDIAKQLGAQIDWQLFGTGPAIIQAFAGGKIDLAYIGLPPAIIGMEQGIVIRCIAGGHMEGTVICAKDRWKAFPEAANLASVLGQFRGMAIGVPGRGSIHDVILQNSLAACGLSREITVRNYPWADLVTEAVVRDEVAAAFGTPALAVAVRRYAGGKLLYPPSRLWPSNPSYGIVATDTFLRAQRALASRFLELHEYASAALRNDPAGAARAIASFVGVVDADFVHETLGISPRYCGQLAEDYVASTMEFVRALRQMGYITRELTASEIFDRTLIDEVHPGPDHYGKRP